MADDEVLEPIVSADPAPKGLRDIHPITLNGTQYAPFKTWDVSYADSVTTHETEGGTQEDATVRRGRRVIDVSTKCIDTVASSLALLNDLDSFSAKFFDIKTAADITTTVRVRAGSMKINLVEKSADLTAVNGLYTVSFTMEEF